MVTRGDPSGGDPVGGPYATPRPDPVRNDPVRNDPVQYDALADQWWRPDGPWAALHWLAAARGALIPPPARSGAVLLDIGCGGGLLAPHVPDGYRHVGVDLAASALPVAAAHGVRAVRADAAALPLADGAADVVVAGEVLEHVVDLEGVVAEAARVLAPGGTVVVDTIADTFRARLLYVHVMERLPGGPPRHLHDPALFVDPARLRALFAAHDVDLAVQGLRASVPDYLAFLARRGRSRRRRDDSDGGRPVRMVPARTPARLYRGVGRKRPAA